MLQRLDSNMREFLGGIAGYLTIALVFLLAASDAFSQTTVPVVVKINWINPTVGCTPNVSPCDLAPLTGAAALTKTQIFADSATIPTTFAGAPDGEAPAPATTFTLNTTGTVGGSVFIRLKACNSSGCSAFSNEASKPIQIPIPGAPNGVTVVTITISVGTSPP